MKFYGIVGSEVSSSSKTTYRVGDAYIMVTKDGLIIGECVDTMFLMRFVYLGRDYLTKVDLVQDSFDYFDLLSDFHNTVIHK